ncbi:MAG TPA: UDP-N-acetylmuramoyl-tripeptide--D-alanyl-D-alanine ligase, partial [Candidatus Marinimicrobia bacterium]|nr:UDP-N-acetylmuramoyl-tripeptide--D-alanyl-D-alanine ligase [Candidatus Neomarinimicrobiota bacterium]
MITANFIRNIKMGSLINFDSNITNVTIDSRKSTSGSMFVALPGENIDGHEFIKSALAKGAALCVVSKNWAQQTDISGLPLWIVESPEKALQQLASNWRNQFNIPILAITGTNGKTTTRAMCEILLGKKYILHCTTENLNNHLGLPLTLLKLTQEHTFSLLELGSNHFGEIAFLSKLCKPNAGLITNIGFGHTEFFRDLQGVAREKEALFQALPDNGISFINLNDPLIVKMNP